MADSHLLRIRVAGNWTILISSDFEFIENDDSWQAIDDSRIVYVSSLEVVDRGGGKDPAEALLAHVAGAFGRPGFLERLEFSEEQVCGRAEITLLESGQELRGVMCGAGTAAACLIEYENETDKDWAVATWRSLRLRIDDESIVAGRPWWRFW